MRKDDLTRLKHMLDAAKEIGDMSSDISRSDLDEDRKLSLALVRLLEILGEAASSISKETQM